MTPPDSVVAAPSRAEPAPGPTGRRLVLLLPGHDTTDIDYHYRRFVYQAGKFDALWNCRTTLGAPQEEAAAPVAGWTAETQGPNWRQASEYRILRWDDLVRRLDARPDVVRLARGLAALAEFIANGTARRYLKATLRYGLFCLFPLAMLVLFLLAGALAGWAAGAVGGLALPPLVAKLTGWAVGLAVFLGLFHQPGRRWRVHHALDDWDLARDYVKGRTPELDARLDRFAEHLVASVQAGAHTEIILIGHSLGATLALRVLEAAFARDPQLGERGVRLGLLTCGATIPKFALHPRAERVRAEAKAVAARAAIDWVEYQARHDAICFYKFHPVTLARAEFDDPAPGRPLLRNANLKQIMTPAKLQRLRWHIMRIHYQVLLANDAKAPYDLFMLALGPVPFRVLATAPDGPLGLFAADGTLLPPTEHPPTK